MCSISPGSGISWGSAIISPPSVGTRGSDAGRGGDEVEVELALQALLDDLHVQQAEEAAAEAEAQRGTVSGSQVSAGSLSCSFSSASFKWAYFAPSMGKMPVNTMGLASR